MTKALIVAVLLLAAAPLASAGLWDTIKQGASDTADAVGDAASKGANAVGGAASNGAKAVKNTVSPDHSRGEIDAMAASTLERLFAERRGAKALFDESVGYAVFDTRKMSFMITTGFGAGVAVDRATKAHTYMNMASGGVNVGMGAQWYQLVFLFETKPKFREFVNHGWDASGGGSLVALDEGATLGATYNDGIAVFQLTEKGLMLAADLTGTKYWKDDELNAR